MKFAMNSKMMILMILLSVLSYLSFSAFCSQDIEQYHYLLLVTEDDEANQNRWTDVIIATIDRSNRQITIDAMDGSVYYWLSEKGPIKLGEAYAKGGEALVAQLLEQCSGINIDSVSVATFEGIADLAGAIGLDVDVSGMIEDGRAGKCVQLRCEQMALLRKAYQILRRLDYQGTYKLAEAVLSNIQTDISVIEALEIGIGLLGGRLVPKDASYMAMNL